jgi:hypothetical protein
MKVVINIMEPAHKHVGSPALKVLHEIVGNQGNSHEPMMTPSIFPWNWAVKLKSEEVRVW